MYTRLRLDGEPSPLALVAEKLATERLVEFDALPDPDHAELESGRKLLREGGFHGTRIPQEFGGKGADVTAYLQVLAELYRMHHLLLPELITANGIGSLPVVLSGTEQQKADLLPGIAAGTTIASFALTEPQAGSDIGALACTAVRDGDHYLLNGEKHLIGNGSRADVLIVIARVESSDGGPSGVTAFLVDSTAPGFRAVGDQPNMGGFEISHLRFEDCRVPASAVLGKVGDGLATAMATLDEGRLHVAAMCIGIADRAIELAAKYTQERVQFGKPIARFDPVRFMIAESYADLSVVVAHARQTALGLAAGEPSRLPAAVAKYMAGEMVVRVVDRCLQAMGAAGYLKEHPMERLYRAARVQKIYDGTSEIMRLIIEKEARRSWA
jgi:acyl-CoA dehydrogenase